MKDLSEVVISVVLAFCGIAITYWILGEWLIALVEQGFRGLRP